MAILRIGYFEGFRGANRILIAGDAEGLAEVASRLRQLENPNSQPLAIHRLPIAWTRDGVELTAYPVDHESGVERVSPGLPPAFTWHHSADGWLEAAESIDFLAQSSEPGHTYLDSTPTSDAHVMISQGEYDEGWWARSGATAMLR